MAAHYARPINRLIEELTRLPGIGPKSAQRLALHLLRRPMDEVRSLAAAMTEARTQVRHCSRCQNLTDIDPCSICGDGDRDDSMICVVERPSDVVAMERMRGFPGRYHVLHGTISPVEGIGPDELRIKELLHRLAAGSILEVVIATNPNVEGEATALYLARLLKPLGTRVTRIARGLPEGGDLDYADEATLARAFEGRREI